MRGGHHRVSWTVALLVGNAAIGGCESSGLSFTPDGEARYRAKHQAAWDDIRAQRYTDAAVSIDALWADAGAETVDSGRVSLWAFKRDTKVLLDPRWNPGAALVREALRNRVTEIESRVISGQATRLNRNAWFSLMEVLGDYESLVRVGTLAMQDDRFRARLTRDYGIGMRTMLEAIGEHSLAGTFPRHEDSTLWTIVEPGAEVIVIPITVPIAGALWTLIAADQLLRK